MFIVYIEVKIVLVCCVNYDKFEDVIQSFDEVMEVVMMIGFYDYLVKVVMFDIDSYNDFIFDKLILFDVIGDFCMFVQICNVKDGCGLLFGYIEG